LRRAVSFLDPLFKNMEQQICERILFDGRLARPSAKGAIYVSNRRARRLAEIARLRICPAVHGAGSREPNLVSDRKARGLRTRSRRGRRGHRTRGRARRRGLQPRASGPGVIQGMKVPHAFVPLQKWSSPSFASVDAVTLPTRGVVKAVRYYNGLQQLSRLPVYQAAAQMAGLRSHGASSSGAVMSALAFHGIPFPPGDWRVNCREIARLYGRLWRNLQRRSIAASRLVAAVATPLFEKLVVEDNKRRYMALARSLGISQSPVSSP